MAQTSVLYSIGKAYEGMLATTEQTRVKGNLNDFINSSGAVLPIGRVVVKKPSTKGELMLPTATGQIVLGITFADPFNIQTTVSNLLTGVEAGYPVGELVPFYTMATGWVYAEAAVAYGDKAYFRHTASAAPNNVLGRFTNAASANHDLLPQAVFRSDTTGAGLAILEFMLPL